LEEALDSRLNDAAFGSPHVGHVLTNPAEGKPNVLQSSPLKLHESLSKLQNW
jgi:hypothetical protein